MPKDAKDAGEKPPDPKKRKECKHNGCDEDAIFLEDYCWEHLPSKAKKKYKAKIEGWVEKENSLEGANLQYANLNSAKLTNANLREADLFLTKLKRADLSYADLSNANLSATDLEEATLWKAVFKGADCFGVNMHHAYLWNALLEDARDLEWSSIEKAGEEDKDYGAWWIAEEVYLKLKNYFHQQGRYRDESKAYYREKLVAKHFAFWDAFRWSRLYGLDWREEKRPFLTHFAKRAKSFWRWLGLSIFHVFTGFGERWWWTVLWALGVVALFAFIYWIGYSAGCFLFDFKPDMIPSIFQYFYLSVVTFATLGFGDITPLNWQAQIPVVIEVIMGYVFLGLIITIIARRFGR